MEERITKRLVKIESRLQRIENKFAGHAGKGITRMTPSVAKKECCGEGYPQRFVYCPFCRKKLILKDNFFNELQSTFGRKSHGRNKK